MQHPASILSKILSFRRLLKLGALIAIVLVMIFSLRLCHLHAQAGKTTEATANKQDEVSCSDEEKQQKRDLLGLGVNDLPKTFNPCWQTESQQLFHELLNKENFVTINPQEQTIKLPAKDYILAQKVAGVRINEKDEKLLDRLYYSIAGKNVLHQVKLWNHSRYFAAMRDNFPQNDETTSRWQVHDQWQEGLDGQDWIPLSYGYVNAGRLPQNYNDWLSASARGTLTFSAEFNIPKARTLSLQIIGKPKLTGLPGKKTLLACYPLSDQERRRGRASTCTKVSQAGSDASAYILQLKLPIGKHRLKIAVEPTVNNELNVDGLPIRLVALENAVKDFALVWVPLREYQRDPVTPEHKRFRFALKTRDGIPLTTGVDAKPSPFTREQGLLPLIGYDSQDRYALSGLVARSDLPRDNTDIHLTLDSQLQTLTQKSLLAQLAKMKGKYASKRRAAVVFLDPNTGAILAAANAPNPPKGVHRWDRLSFSRLFPNRDPFKVNAWQGLDNYNAPGSTFKTITALTALQAADDGRGDVEQMLGGLSGRAFENLTGIPVSARSYDPDGIPEKLDGRPNPDNRTSVVSNFKNGTLSNAFGKGKDANGRMVYRKYLRVTKGEGCPSRSVPSTDLGLKEAVRDSLNVWFARLAVMIDENDLASGGDETQLVAMARRLGFGDPFSLSPQELPLKRIGSYGGGRGDVLNAFPGSLTLETQSEGIYASNSALQRLAQNSFGQGVSATPLQMARVMSAIATQRIPTPWLIAQWDGDTLKAPKSEKLRLSNLELLHAGMKAVPEVGTAKDAFKRIYPKGRCRVYGKTGTAQVSPKLNLDTGWFVGWQEDKNGNPEFSFACMVTHLGARQYGGSVCGPIIAQVLRDLEKAKTQAAKGNNNTGQAD